MPCLSNPAPIFKSQVTRYDHSKCLRSFVLASMSYPYDFLTSCHMGAESIEMMDAKCLDTRKDPLVAVSS